MGDMADMINDSMFENDDDFDPPLPRTCIRCGREGLHWELRGVVYRLCDDRGIHKCVQHLIVNLPKNL